MFIFYCWLIVLKHTDKKVSMKHFCFKSLKTRKKKELRIDYLTQNRRRLILVYGFWLKKYTAFSPTTTTFRNVVRDQILKPIYKLPFKKTTCWCHLCYNCFMRQQFSRQNATSHIEIRLWEWQWQVVILPVSVNEWSIWATSVFVVFNSAIVTFCA